MFDLIITTIQRNSTTAKKVSGYHWCNFLKKSENTDTLDFAIRSQSLNTSLVGHPSIAFSFLYCKGHCIDKKIMASMMS